MSCLTTKNQGYFEGVITYKIESQSNQFGVSNESLSNYYGTRAIKYIKAGSYYTRFYNDKGDLVRESLFNNSTGIKLNTSISSDYVSRYHCKDDVEIANDTKIKSVGSKKNTGSQLPNHHL